MARLCPGAKGDVECTILLVVAAVDLVVVGDVLKA